MDVLSEVLRAVKLEGALFFNAEFSAPWCLRLGQSIAIAPYVAPAAGRLILYHFLTEGRAYVHLPEGQPQELRAGDIVVFPRGDAHVLGNGSPVKPTESLQGLAEHFTRGLELFRFGGGGEVTRFVCGFLACPPRLGDAFLAGLPPLLKVNVVDGPSGRWLEHSIRFSVDGVNRSDAGSALLLAKLSEVLFVETLRRYINSLPPRQTGWLAGARDPLIGRALALMHREPAHPWTVSNLARRVGLSRTGLADRFRHLVGQSPMAYLAQWRLRLGAEILESSEDGVAEVAARVGYGSEAAFNRAFKREFDCPPAQFRRRRMALPAQRTLGSRGHG
jgi:AraC-like DNA-binding protein